jgi:hypothetical protein
MHMSHRRQFSPWGEWCDAVILYLTCTCVCLASLLRRNLPDVYILASLDQ